MNILNLEKRDIKKTKSKDFFKPISDTFHLTKSNGISLKNINSKRGFSFADYYTRNIQLSNSLENWSGLVNIDSRVKIMDELLSKNLTKKNLTLVSAVLKSASIGIIPKDDKNLEALRDKLFEKFSQIKPNERENMYEVLSNIYKEIPIHKKIKNRGPMRHGILGFKDHIVRGDKWEKLGAAGDFPRTLHQLAHQVPALELGYICKAYAQYLKTNGNINEFDRVVRENGVNFEEYFVKNAERIAEKSKEGKRWNQISSDKPKGVLNVNDEDMKKAFMHRGWTGKNIDELMNLPGSKVANFFDIYGDTVIETLKGYGVSLFNENENLKKILSEKELKTLNEIEALRKTIQDNPSSNDDFKYNQAFPKLLELSTNTRKDILNKIYTTKNPDHLRSLTSLDNNLESIVDNASINILAKAPKESASLYKLDKKTQDLLIDLMSNYAFISPIHKDEFSLLKRDLTELFNKPDKNSNNWCERIMVPLNRLDRLVQNISNNISDQYRPLAINLAKHNKNDPSALSKVDSLADGLLRGSLLFPISQIYSGFRSEIKKLSKSSPLQILSPGEKFGKVIFAKNMEELEKIVGKNKLEDQRLICFVDTLSGAEEPPKGVHGIITPKVLDTLAHIGVRARQENICFACIDDYNHYENLKKNFTSLDSYSKLTVKHGREIAIDTLTKNEYENLLEKEKKVEVTPEKVIIPKADLDDSKTILDVEDIKLSKSGPKATNIANLAKAVPIPPSLSIPFGMFHKVINHELNKNILADYNKTLDIVNSKQAKNDITVSKDCEHLKSLIKKLVIPKSIETEILNAVKKSSPEGTKFVMTRSSTNGEDLSNFSGAGLYSSQPNSTSDIINGIKVVWASKWNKRAFDARVKAQIPHKDLNVAVLLQPCIDTKYGFVTHTVNPISKNPDEVFIEMVQGQNEALVSGKIPGTGYGFIFNKKTGDVKREHLADKSYQFLPSDDGGTRIVLADYKDDLLAGDKHKWESMVKEIGEYSVKIEKMYKGVPQDIEGCIEPKKLKTYIVQTRDQLGLKS